MATTASAVSALLRRGGLNPVAASARHQRDGIAAVNSGGRVLVVASVVGSPQQELQLIADARAVLTAAGYRLAEGASPNMIYVNREV